MNLNDEALYECDNCGRLAKRYNLPDVKHIHLRIEPGGVYTDKECAVCSALCYPVEETPKPRLWEVCVLRTGTRRAQFTVEAVGQDGATLEALDQARDHDFSTELEHDADYEVLWVAPAAKKEEPAR